MEFALYAALWVAASVSAFFILCADYRKLWDVKFSDLPFLVGVSIFGPVSLVAAIVVYLIGLSVDSGRDSKVLWRKK